MRRIAFYGKGGIGKSTIASNISAFLANSGKKVLHIGCDPKADSIRTLVKYETDTFLDVFKEKGQNIKTSDFIHKGVFGVNCIEAGGPVAGVGCAGMGITTMINELERLDVLNQDWDYIIYDVLGDVVCGGFALPMKQGYIDKVYIVTSTDYMSFYAANNIIKSVENFDYNDNLMGGIIFNRMNNTLDITIANLFSKLTNIPIIGYINSSNDIKLADMHEKTIVETYPDSYLTTILDNIVTKIGLDQVNNSFTSLSKEALKEFRLRVVNLEGKNINGTT